jgi:hypothetical protein
MAAKQEVMGMIQQLSEDQLQNVLNYIKMIFVQLGKSESQMDEEQKGLLDLLNYTIDTGREDFAEKHDDYLYRMQR